MSGTSWGTACVPHPLYFGSWTDCHGVLLPCRPAALPHCCQSTSAAPCLWARPVCSMTDLFSRYFGQYSSSIQGVGGDQVMHLMWRLQNGALPTQHQVRVLGGAAAGHAVQACRSFPPLLLGWPLLGFPHPLLNAPTDCSPCSHGWWCCSSAPTTWARSPTSGAGPEQWKRSCERQHPEWPAGEQKLPAVPEAACNPRAC